MPHGYRTLQHWNQWLGKEYLGGCLLETERADMSRLLARHFGKHAVLIGVPAQLDLLHATTVPCHTLITPLAAHDKWSNFIVEGDWHDLPIATGSVDLVILPHALEFVNNPRQLLAEACRIVKPEGLLLICGFNPYSAWGLKRQLNKQKRMPWAANFMHANEIKKWLQLADFEMEAQSNLLFRPPLARPSWYEKMHLLERIGGMIAPSLGGVYILLARAKVVPLTPIKMRWTQQLSGASISTVSTIQGI